MPSLDHFSFLAPFYEKFIPPRLPEQLLSLLELPVTGAILDAGGGTGRLAQFLGPYAKQVIVFDESLAMTLQAHQKKSVLPACGQTEFLPFPDSTFQRIIMVDALHHVADQSHTIQELWRVLAPGGILIIEDPDIRHVVAKFIALFEKLALMRSHFLSPAQIQAFMPQDAEVHIQSQLGTAWVKAVKQP